jgi:DNA-directed RNA polymerase subunit RPC12/RpoP
MSQTKVEIKCSTCGMLLQADALVQMVQCPRCNDYSIVPLAGSLRECPICDKRIPADAADCPWCQQVPIESPMAQIVQARQPIDWAKNGIVLTIAAAVMALVFFLAFYDVSADGKFANLQRMNDRLAWVITSAVVLLCGVIAACLKARRPQAAD